MRTAAWYGDHGLDLQFPESWDVDTLQPRTPAPLRAGAIAETLRNPFGQEALQRLARGKRRPVVIVDDMNRPTPVDRILPSVLSCFPDPAAVTVVVATGTHGPPHPAALVRKIGTPGCRVVVHDPRRGDLNEEVASSDFLLGIGGIYPNHTAGFGGGSKLVLGVLGFRRIESLHFRHRSVGWGNNSGCSFRAELDEIARGIGLLTVISAHVNQDRELIRIVSGDHFAYHAAEAEFARCTFSAPEPADADVVISNAYPNDLSLTFAQMKGMTPLSRCRTEASRVAIAACPEGMGCHGLFPFPAGRKRNWRHLSRLGPRTLMKKAVGRFKRRSGPLWANRVWVYRPGEHAIALPPQAGGLQITESWPAILEGIRAEQAGKTRLKVSIYACAPLQPLEVGAMTRSTPGGSR